MPASMRRSNGRKVPATMQRNFTDFEYETTMAGMNRSLAPGIEIVFLLTEPQFAHLSSSLIKEIVLLRGSVKGMVPPLVERAAGHHAQQPGVVSTYTAVGPAWGWAPVPKRPRRYGVCRGVRFTHGHGRTPSDSSTRGVAGRLPVTHAAFFLQRSMRSIRRARSASAVSI